MKLRYTLRAQQDLSDIFDMIATESPSAADRIQQYMRASLDALGTWPRLGALTDLDHVRRLPFVRYPYTAFYRVDDAKQEVQVLRIVHSARIRDLRSLPPDE